MRFDELILQGDPDDELRIRFHPALTVLSGVGPDERAALAASIFGALAGGPESTVLRYLDAVGEHVIVRGHAGQISARRADGTPAPPPLGAITADPAAVRALMLLQPDDLGAPIRPHRDDEPPELREARQMLDELTDELDAARHQQERTARLQARLDELDSELRVALDSVARREYAEVLAQLERVRAEAAALQTGAAGVEADRHLLAGAADAAELARSWQRAAAQVLERAGALEGRSRLEPEDRDRLAAIPAEPPGDLDVLVARLRSELARCDHLDKRLQALSVAKLPAPSDPLVADLGLLEQESLWRAAERLVEAGEAMQRVQLSLGGVELEEMGPPLAVIEEIEQAHTDLEAAERAAAAARLPGLAAGVGGLAVAALGTLAAPVLLPVGLTISAGGAVAGIVRPRLRRARAAQVEAGALARADATSYLAFHIRRVEASIDPQLRELVDATTLEHRTAAAGFADLAGADISVHAAMTLRSEIEAYNEAVRNLGETADEIEQLRRELEDEARPAQEAARHQLVGACAPYLLDDDSLHDLDDVAGLVADRCASGLAARDQVALEEAEADEQKTGCRLDDLLLQLGFDAGPLDARVGALEWAVSRAAEREEARARARPRAEIDAELVRLQEVAADLRRPEWATVTAAEASAPDISELEAQRAELVAELAEVRGDIDVERLSDRHAAVERRVAALEARHGGPGGSTDPAVLAELQQRLLAHLTTAGQAGPDGDPVPVVLDEVFLRVPADRKWDLLDLLLRVSEQHQLVYLSDDAFIAAWARQRALDGAITLLELAPEPEPV